MIYSKEDAAKLIIETGLELVETGLIARTWGNISARISETEMLITPSGIDYYHLTPDNLVTVSLLDESFSGEISPSSERGVHIEGYRHRPEIGFIVHTHQLFATAYGTLGVSFDVYDKSGKELLGDYVPCAAYGISSTKTLRNKMKTCIKNNPNSNSFFMRYHGVLCLGTTKEAALSAAHILETSCNNYMKQQIRTQTKHSDFKWTDLCKTYLEYHNYTRIPYTPRIRKEIEDQVLSFVKKHPKATFHNCLAPEVIALSYTNQPLLPTIDDMAQICGTRIPCIDPTNPHWVKQLEKGFQHQNVVLLRGLGAICMGATEEDVEACEKVLQKNCFAQLYASFFGQKHHLGFLDSYLQRQTYVKKYSKLNVC